MGRTNTDPNAVMAARLVLLKADAGDEAIVAAASYDGDVFECAPGMREFRKEGDRIFVDHKIFAATTSGNRYTLCVIWTPSATRDEQNKFAALTADFGANVVKSWATVLTTDGLTLPTLDADNTTIGTAVKANWPANWRIRLPGDSPGDATAVPAVPAALPTGPLIIGNVLA